MRRAMLLLLAETTRANVAAATKCRATKGRSARHPWASRTCRRSLCRYGDLLALLC